ncbi:phospholipase C/P1 nuclease domain-containing protein [Sparassis latifolia]
MRILAFSVGVGLTSLPAVHAWGAAGHEIVATIAQIYLHPSVLPVVCDILYPPEPDVVPATSAPSCNLASIASWADRVRRTPEYSRTGTLHYIGAHDDAPGATCAFPGPKGWIGRQDHNVLGAMRNASTILQQFVGDGSYGRADGEEALKFLVHWVGDMHMPLHLTGKERGGNGAKVLFDGRLTNLHSVWDTLLIASALRTIPQNYTRPLRGYGASTVERNLRGAIYDPYVRRIMHEGFGVGAPTLHDGRFGAYTEWLTCPAVQDPSPESFLEKAQAFFGLGGRRPKRPDEERWDDGVLCPYAWAVPIHQLNCEIPIWPKELETFAQRVSPKGAVTGAVGRRDDGYDHIDLSTHPDFDSIAWGGKPRPHPGMIELDTPEYAGQVRERWVIERLLAMAGIRLAAILNGLLAGEANATPLMELYL